MGVDLATVQTNMVYADIATTGLAVGDIAARLAERGVLVHAVSSTRVRAVTRRWTSSGSSRPVPSSTSANPTRRPARVTDSAE